MNRIFKIAIVTLLSLILMGTVQVKALSENDLLKKLTSSYDINGYTFQLSEGDKALVKRYLDENEISSADADYIATKIDEAIQILKDSGATDFSDFSKLPSATKNKLKSLVTDIASNTSVKATVKKGSVVIYNADGSVFAEITKLVKNTGSSMYVIPALALLIIATGAFIITRKPRKTNA